MVSVHKKKCYCTQKMGINTQKKVFNTQKVKFAISTCDTM